MALTRVVASGIATGGDYEVVTLTTSGNIQVGSATTIHTGGFQIGSSNLHSTGLTVQNLNATGVITATSFIGDISQATGAAAGLGTALSQDQSSSLNQLYYTDKILSVGSTITVDPPSSSNIAYTQYSEIAVEEGYDLIVEDGDDLVPDILGLSTGTAAPLSGAGGRVRADQFTNKAGTGAPSFPNGVVVTGVVTATSFSGDGSALTGIDATSLKDSGGNVKIQANTSGAVVTGVLTSTSFSGPLTGNLTGNVTGDVTGNLTGNVTGNVTGNLTGTASTATAASNSYGLLGTPNLSNAVIQNLRGLSGGGVLVCAANSNSSTSGSWPQTVDFVLPMGDLTDAYENAVKNYYSSGQTGATYSHNAGAACLLLASCWNTYYWGYATKLYLCTVYGNSTKVTALQQLHSYSAAGHPSSGASISLSVVSTTNATPKLKATFSGDYWNSNAAEVVMFGGGFASPACLGPTALSSLHPNLTGQDAAWK